jgi:hypothetical protein
VLRDNSPERRVSTGTEGPLLGIPAAPNVRFGARDSRTGRVAVTAALSQVGRTARNAVLLCQERQMRLSAAKVEDSKPEVSRIVKANLTRFTYFLVVLATMALTLGAGKRWI